LPDIYQPGQYDLAGTIVGVVEESAALHGDLVRAGDVFDRLRVERTAHQRVHPGEAHRVRSPALDVQDPFPDTGRTVAQVLLDVHTSYVAAVTPVLPRLHALAQHHGRRHSRQPRAGAARGCEAVVECARVVVAAGVPRAECARRSVAREMRRVFNLGVGMIAAAARDDTEAVIAAAKRAGIAAWIIGEIRAGTQGVKFAER